MAEAPAPKARLGCYVQVASRIVGTAQEAERRRRLSGATRASGRLRTTLLERRDVSETCAVCEVVEWLRLAPAGGANLHAEEETWRR
jgi:hypothetical protein